MEGDQGWNLVFHPDLIRKSELGKKIEPYSYFLNTSNKAFHLLDDERKIVTEIQTKKTIRFRYSDSSILWTSNEYVAQIFEQFTEKGNREKHTRPNSSIHYRKSKKQAIKLQ